MQSTASLTARDADQWKARYVATQNKNRKCTVLHDQPCFVTKIFHVSNTHRWLAGQYTCCNLYYVKFEMAINLKVFTTLSV